MIRTTIDDVVHFRRDGEGRIYVPPEDLPLVRRVRMVRAQATKMETAREFPDYLEKAETGSIGRALALCSYGTQFAPDMHEGDRVADAPQEARRGDEAGIVCSTPDCGRKLTKGQAEFSARTFGEPLCPGCQRAAKGGQ